MTAEMGHATATDARLAAWDLFLEAQGTLLCRLERELHTECGLPLTWYTVLLRLGDAPDRRLRMQELVGSLMLTKSGITRLVDRMAAAGLIARTTCPSDRRGAFASLTDAGSATLQRATPIHRRGIQQHFGNQLTDDELRALTRVLTKLMASAPPRHRAPACLPRTWDDG